MFSLLAFSAVLACDPGLTPDVLNRCVCPNADYYITEENPIQHSSCPAFFDPEKSSGGGLNYTPPPKKEVVEVTPEPEPEPEPEKPKKKWKKWKKGHHGHNGPGYGNHDPKPPKFKKDKRGGGHYGNGPNNNHKPKNHNRRGSYGR